MSVTVRSFLSPARVIVGIAAVAWILVAVAPWQSLADSASTPVAVTLMIWGWTLWVLAAVALLVPSPPSLTALRCITPVAVVCSVWDASPFAVFGSVVALIISFSPLFADVMVQGGAYGDEQRFALRTPVPHMAPTCVAWTLFTVSLIGGTLLLTSGQYVTGIPLTIIGVVLATRVPRLLHRHARRWLVVVPAGIVAHDHLVLAETVMSMRSKVANVDIVSDSGEAADFTGGVAGQRLVIHLKEADKVVMSPITARMLGTTEALHVMSYAIAPRRISAARAAIKM